MPGWFLKRKVCKGPDDPDGPFIDWPASLQATVSSALTLFWVLSPYLQRETGSERLKLQPMAPGGPQKPGPASSEPVTYSIVKGFETIAELIQHPAVFMMETRPRAGELSLSSQPAHGRDNTESGSFQHRASEGATLKVGGGQASGGLSSLAPASAPSWAADASATDAPSADAVQDTLPLSAPLVPSEPSV